MCFQGSDEAGSRLSQHDEASNSMDERLSSSKQASSSATGFSAMLQEGFTEGVVSVKEAAVYISKRENRYGASNLCEGAGECDPQQLFVSAEAVLTVRLQHYLMSFNTLP